MKQASAATLQVLNELLVRLRCLPGLIERKPGIFYVRSKAYLHFHEVPAGLFADSKLTDGEFERFPDNTTQEQEALVELIARQHLS
jgi:hypothetical protein